MYEATVIVTLVLLLVSGIDYARRAWIRESNPAIATWILMTVTFILSFWMYWESPRKSWTANIGLTAGLANILIILFGVIAANIRYGTLRIAFDRVQQWCLVGGVVVVLFWAITNQPLISYSLIQCIAIIAYIATVKRLWRAKRSTEPLFLWVSVLLAGLCALYPAWVKNDPFAWIYLGRAIPSTIFMVYLITRIRYRMKQVVR